MAKKLLFALTLLLAFVSTILLLMPHKPQPAGAADYKNATYIIDGRSVTLVNGVAEEEAAPGSASKIVTRYFGNEVRKDLNGDGREDVVFLLTQQTGGSGTFFYAVAALNTPQGYVGSQGLFLGDRIAPQTTESGRGNIVIINYADRAPGQPFTVQPSVGKSIWLLLDPATMQFGEVAQNFEGESAFPGRGWATTTDAGSGITFEYPKDLTTQYVSAVDWPPKAAVAQEPFSCTEAGSVSAPAGKTERRMIDGSTYCVTTETQGAAGSMYSLYAYATPFGSGKTLILTFSLRFPQCANYDGPQKTACADEERSFNIDGLINYIARSAVLK